MERHFENNLKMRELDSLTLTNKLVIITIIKIGFHLCKPFYFLKMVSIEDYSVQSVLRGCYLTDTVMGS